MSLCATQHDEEDKPFPGYGVHACTEAQLLCTCHACHIEQRGCLEWPQPEQHQNTLHTSYYGHYRHIYSVLPWYNVIIQATAISEHRV